MSRSSEILSSIDFTADPHALVAGNIIPAMDKRRGRSETLPSSVVLRRLTSIDDLKPGELVELFEAQLQGENRLTPQLASEFADVYYYSRQPACPLFLADPSVLFNTYGISLDLVAMLCAVKYLTRISYGDESDYKEIEYEVIADFLASRQLLNRPLTVATNQETELQLAVKHLRTVLPPHAEQDQFIAYLLGSSQSS